jgi:uncharacterized protein YndB with AHSA1/START domain
MTRRIENSIEVPGTPEAVWEAIATGSGIEAWFVPARVADGRVALDMGGGMEDAGRVIASEPPVRFAYEEEWRAVEGEPPGRLATAGTTCSTRAAPAREVRQVRAQVSLGLAEARVGERVAIARMAGVVEYRGRA